MMVFSFALGWRPVRVVFMMVRLLRRRVLRLDRGRDRRRFNSFGIGRYICARKRILKGGQCI